MMAAVLVLDQSGFTRSVRSERLRKKAALQGNGHSMRAIIGAELRKNVLHVRLHGGFGQVELIGNDLVGGACRDTAKYLDLTFGEDIVGNVLCKFFRDFGRDAAAALMHRPNGINQICSKRGFEHVPGSARLEGSQSLNISAIGCQHNETSGREFETYRLDGLYPENVVQQE